MASDEKKKIFNCKKGGNPKGAGMQETPRIGLQTCWFTDEIVVEKDWGLED